LWIVGKILTVRRLRLPLLARFGKGRIAAPPRRKIGLRRSAPSAIAVAESRARAKKWLPVFREGALCNIEWISLSAFERERSNAG